MSGPQLERFADPELVARAAAARVTARLVEAVASGGRGTLVLSGGSTPLLLYRRLAAEPTGTVPWRSTIVFFGDERCVPPDHADSNYRAAREALLDHVPVPSGQVHRIRGELGPHVAAEDYERVLRSVFPGLPAPAFDVVLLGVGTDGHTASLFPGTAALDEGERWVAASEAPSSAAVRERVTLTLPALTGAVTLIILAAGAEKRPVLSAVFSGADGTLPVARVHGRGATIWLVDGAAAPVRGSAR